MTTARSVALVLAASVAVAVVSAQQRLEVLPVQGNVFVIVGPGGNTTVQIGAEGPLVVDTQPAALSVAVLDAIRSLTPQSIRHIVLTSGDDQAAGGAGALSKAGRYVRVIDSIDPRGSDARASIIAHLNVLNRMNATKAPADTWPTDTYFTPQWTLFSNGEAVRFIHVPAGHTDGDTMVFFRRSDVIASGAIFDTTAYPRFDPDRGGTIAGVLDALNRVIEIAVPGESQQGGTVIVPGRGRLSDQTEVANYRDMATIVRDRVREHINKGHSLAEVKRAKPTLDYDGLFDAQSDGWNGERFVEAIYRDLSRRAR
jgi:glyoxylase-like metal-dependent hydrolase (beta-lactamase superfamily II)